MKTSTVLILGLSLTTNAALLVTLVVRSGDEPGPSAGSAASIPHDNSAIAEQSRPGDKAATSRRAPTQGNLWQQLASRETSATLNHLRQAGFPEDVIRAVARELVNQRYKQRERQVWNPDQPLPPFWEAQGSRFGLDPDTQAQLRELDREKQQELLALLGELPVDDRTRFYMRRRYGDLPPEKLTALVQINSDYSDLMSQIRQGAIGSIMMPWDREQLDYIEQEQRADIEELLTAEELELHDLYGSRTANSLRNKLGNFATTETEFRELYALQQAFDEKFDLSRGIPSADVMRTMRSAQEDLENQFKAVLGEDRYADFKRSSNADYRAASSVVEHFKLPVENAVAVYELTQDLQQRARAVQTDRDLPPEQRNARMSELAAEAAAQLDNLLTPAGARAYRDSGAARWLMAIEPRPAPRP